MNFLVDNQLPRALGRFLCDRNHVCEHVMDVGLAKASDAEIWQYAGTRKCALFSKDEDFLYLANRAERDAQLIWVRFGNCRTSTLLAAMERLWPRVEALLQAGERVIELRE